MNETNRHLDDSANSASSANSANAAPLTRAEILRWLRESNENKLAELWQRADATRQQRVGDAIHLRALVEISNHCIRKCSYCGLHADHQNLTRYRMNADEILACAHEAVEFGYGTIVMQSGEDYGLTKTFISDVIRRIKSETPLAITLSLGERMNNELIEWRKAGADRYLLRFETSNSQLYEAIHPSLPNRQSDRFAILRFLQQLGYETGSGIMVGIPGQSFDTLADDIVAFGELDLDMIGIGPYISHPDTPLATRNDITMSLDDQEQVPNSELMTYKAVALARLVCPHANIPSTTALATINRETGRELGLARGANVVMLNLTPVQYRQLYEIYPAKTCLTESAEVYRQRLLKSIEAMGRHFGVGPGGVKR